MQIFISPRMSQEGEVSISRIEAFVRAKSTYQKFVYMKELLAGLCRYEGRIRANIGPRMNNVMNQNLHCFTIAAILVLENENDL